MDTFEEYLETIKDEEHKKIMGELFEYIEAEFPMLQKKVGWNQPMYTDHGTFIIAFSMAKQHFSVNPEMAGIEFFQDEITKNGYTSTKGIFRIPWNGEINYELIHKIIEFNIREKADYTAFWRK